MIIGNPLGLDRSVNYGSVTNAAEGFLITDAAINPGNSGGPVFNSLGEVVGVASAKLVADGIDRIGLVIPLANLCEQVLECEVGQWER
jgi:serine protease Do